MLIEIQCNKVNSERIDEYKVICGSLVPSNGEADTTYP